MQLFNSIISNEGITLNIFLLSLGTAFLCGVISAIASSVKAKATKSFLISLILLPMVVYTVITMVNGNIGTGVAVMGAFSLVRFRSVPGKAKDIASIFLAMTSGLACASGYVGIALVFTILVCAVMVALSFIPMGNEKEMDLHITVPESLHFAKEFDDIFKNYTKKFRLVKAKTSNMGSLYILNYRIQLKNCNQMQEFMNEIRCRNGNLEVSVSEPLEGIEEL